MNEKKDNEKYCSECGAIINIKAEICPKCGVRQMPVNFDQGGKSKLVAALLGICLGIIGIHKFYLGRITWGVVYLLFCWTFIPAIIGIIEGIVYLASSDEDFNAKYNSSNT